MQYFVVDQNSGQKYGPADLATLNQWIAQGRVVPESLLQDCVSGQRYMAIQVPGLNFPIQQYQSPVGPPNHGYQAQPMNIGYSRQQVSPGDNGSSDITLAYVFNSIVFFGSPCMLCCGPAGLGILTFGGLAIWKSSEARKKGHPGGPAALVVSIVITALAVLASIMLSIFGAVLNS